MLKQGRVGGTLGASARRRGTEFLGLLNLTSQVLDLEPNQFDRRQKFGLVELIPEELPVQRSEPFDVLVQPRSWRRQRPIALCCAVFIIVLTLSAYWDQSIRVLHVFEALPYLLAGALCFRYSKFGYALGFAGGALWLGHQAPLQRPVSKVDEGNGLLPLLSDDHHAVRYMAAASIIKLNLKDLAAGR
jgi:hypothetical protein